MINLLIIFLYKSNSFVMNESIEGYGCLFLYMFIINKIICDYKIMKMYCNFIN